MSASPNRRQILEFSLASAGGMGSLLQHEPAAASHSNNGPSFGKAKSVIVMFCWGGMSHLDTFDMKPSASSDIRGEFQPIGTSVPGLHICEHLPQISQLMHHLAVVRSVHHQSGDHRKAAYWNLTGHRPGNAEGGVVPPELPSREDWPSVGSQVAIAMANDSRYRRAESVRRQSPVEISASEVESRIDFEQLKIHRTVDLSTDVMGPGRYSAGSFDHQDGYSNGHTVELVGMISLRASQKTPITKDPTGQTIDFSSMVFGDGTAGDMGCDTHGRGGNLWLRGDGDSDSPHSGFGCHANKFITFDLQEIRRRHFQNSQRPFVIKCRVGINGSPGVHESAVGQAGIWIDGKPSAISRLLYRDVEADHLESVIRPGDELLTLAMLNGNDSTFFDDVAMCEVQLLEVEGPLPDPMEEEADQDADAIEMSRDFAANLPRTISVPYPLADRGLLNGQYGGFLGLRYDPVFVHPGSGTPFRGISPQAGTLDLKPHGASRRRIAERGQLLDNLNAAKSSIPLGPQQQRLVAAQDQALNMLLSSEVQSAFDLSKERRRMHELYGNHISGQSTLLARRLTDAGVPLVTVNLSVGDLNGASGDHWDTHGDNFNKLRNNLLPRWDQAASALLTDLIETGKIDETLVVFLTEFGRTPKINAGAGRDHFPSCYSILFAGAGVSGGSILGASDQNGTQPTDDPCTPEDIHATIFHSLGIPRNYMIHDQQDRPYVMCEGTPLSIYG